MEISGSSLFLSPTLYLWINNGSLGELCSKCIVHTVHDLIVGMRVCINRIVVKTI